MKKKIIGGYVKKLGLFILGLVLVAVPFQVRAGYDPNRIIDEEVFTNSNAMSDTKIQSFLTEKNSVLAGYSEGGRSAATIIGNAARVNGVNPQVLLSTLQKEQSLITLTTYDTTGDPSGKLRRAMGYACPDAGSCDARYAGFANQVEGAAFQFRYNFDGSATKRFTDYQVGQTMTFDGTAVYLSNRATAALYRYTPHISGNRSFYNTYFGYFLEYSSKWGSQNAYPTLAPGDSYHFQLGFENTGNKNWERGTVKLGTDQPKDRLSAFSLENRLNNDETMWSSNNRIALRQQTVPVGSSGTFDFYMTAPNTMAPGVYREYFRPLAEGIQWMDDERIFWDVTVANHQAKLASQNVTTRQVEPGESFQLEVKLENTGKTIWRRDYDTAVRLGTSGPHDRVSPFIREDQATKEPSGWANENRVQLIEPTVAPGETGTFRFWYTVPTNMKPGTYKEMFQPVHEKVRWMDDLGISFDIVVGPQKAAYLSQSNYPTLSRGQSAQFSVSFQNTGTTAWYKGGNAPMQLGTLRTQDRLPGFERLDAVTNNPSGWAKENRVSLVQDAVRPGETGTFTFWYTVPGDKAPGTYREYFGLVQDTIGWLPDNGLFWDITVQ